MVHITSSSFAVFAHYFRNRKMWYLKTVHCQTLEGDDTDCGAAILNQWTDAHFATPNYHGLTHKRKRWQYMFWKTYHHNSCQSFFSIVLMPIVHPTMKSSVTSAILRKESCIYSHWHVKQQVNLMDTSHVNIHNKRKSHALLDPCKKFLLFIIFKFQSAGEKHGKVRKIKRDMTKNSLDKTQLSLGWMPPSTAVQ